LGKRIHARRTGIAGIVLGISIQSFVVNQLFQLAEKCGRFALRKLGEWEYGLFEQRYSFLGINHPSNPFSFVWVIAV
jgi:hypothetical protein